MEGSVFLCSCSLHMDIGASTFGNATLLEPQLFFSGANLGYVIDFGQIGVGQGKREAGTGWGFQRLVVWLGQVEKQFPESSNQQRGSDVIRVPL